MGTRQQIIDAVATRLKTITTANGYGTALGERVYLWKFTDLQASSLPAITLRDTVDQMDPAGINNRRDHELTVELDLACKGDASPASVRNLIADVLACIGVDETWGGLAYATHISRAAIDMEPSDRLYTWSQLTITVLYRTALWAH